MKMSKIVTFCHLCSQRIELLRRGFGVPYLWLPAVLYGAQGRCCTNRQDSEHLLKRPYEEEDAVSGAGSVPDMDIGGFNVLRILGIKKHRIQI